MTISTVSTIVTGLGPLETLTIAGDILIVTNTGQLVASGAGGAVSVTAASTQALISGTVAGEELGLDYTLSGGNDRVMIGATGTVFGGIAAMHFGASARVVNHGSVFGGAMALVFGATSSVNSFENHGSVYADTTAIHRPSGANSGLRLINYGTISGGDGSVAMLSEAEFAVERVLNRGTIIGDIYLGGGDDTYDGRNGVLEGDLHLGDGSDFYDGKNGTVEGIIRGDGGDDTFRAGAAVETIYGGSGVDALDFIRSNSITLALDGSFAGTGAAAGDSYAAIENVNGSAFGNDRIRGNEGDNSFFGFGGNDSLEGMGGNDYAEGDDGNDSLFGGEGLDSLFGGADNDVIFGGNGNDSLDGGFGANTLEGGSGNDVIAMNGSGQILAGNDNDSVSEGVEIVLVDLGDGNDTVSSGGGGDTLMGGLGIDTLDLRDIVSGLTINLATGFNTTGDTISGFENVEGSDFGGDFLSGTADANIFFGNGGDDILVGDAGNDTIFGGAGIDQIAGGLGADTLIGGGDDDVFIFSSVGERIDRISDFSAVALGDDLLVFFAAGFGGGLVGNGNATLIDPTQFQSRADNLAQDANDRFIFRTTDRSLWYDANGNLAGGAVAIVFVQAGAVITANDIFIA